MTPLHTESSQNKLAYDDLQRITRKMELTLKEEKDISSTDIVRKVLLHTADSLASQGPALTVGRLVRIARAEPPAIPQILKPMERYGYELHRILYGKDDADKVYAEGSDSIQRYSSNHAAEKLLDFFEFYRRERNNEE